MFRRWKLKKLMELKKLGKRMQGLELEIKKDSSSLNKLKLNR